MSNQPSTEPTAAYRPGWLEDDDGLFADEPSTSFPPDALVTFRFLRDALRRHLRIWLVLAIVGLAAVIAYAGYRYRLDNGPLARFEQARYLLPLLPLWGAMVVLAVRTVGRRWGAALGGVVVMASVALTVFAQLLTIDRYYS